MKTVLITGASGNLGGKLRRHLEGRYDLRLIDRDARGDDYIVAADLSNSDDSWMRNFQGVDAVVHLAADPTATQTWANLIAPNVDALINAYQAAAQGGVRRFVFASSNHVMGRYKDLAEPRVLTTDLPPNPGARYDGDPSAGAPSYDSIAYGSAKLIGERLGKCYADYYGMSVIAVRIGWVRPGDNLASDIPAERDDWFRLMWLSNRDYCQLMEKCIEADPKIRFAIVNGMSRNTGMRWDLEYTKQMTGYEPEDDVRGS